MADSSFISGLRGGAFDGGQGARSRVLQAAVGSSTPARKPMSRCGDGDDPAPLESSRRTVLHSAVKLVSCAPTLHWGSDLSNMTKPAEIKPKHRRLITELYTYTSDLLPKKPTPACTADAYHHRPFLNATWCLDAETTGYTNTSIPSCTASWIGRVCT